MLVVVPVEHLSGLFAKAWSSCSQRTFFESTGNPFYGFERESSQLFPQPSNIID
jgi:hypothetical protein